MRIYTSCSDPIDFCKNCFPDADEGEERYGDVGDGPDGRGNCYDYDCYDYDSDHPPYEGEYARLQTKPPLTDKTGEFLPS